jgi:CBS domain-containing protein
MSTAQAAKIDLVAPGNHGTLVREAMRPEILACSAEAPLPTVAEAMAREHVHCIVVRGEPGHDREDRWAVVSDDTLLRNMGPDFARRTAGWVASADYPTITPSETVQHAVDLMIMQHVRHLVVVDEVTRRPLGVISTLDVVRVLGREDV